MLMNTLCLQSICTTDAYFYFSSQRSTESSTPGLLNTRVISSDSLYIGVNNHIIVRVSKTVQNITLTLTPTAITEHRRRQNCLPTIHQQHFNQSLQAGQSSFVCNRACQKVSHNPLFWISQAYSVNDRSLTQSSWEFRSRNGLWECCYIFRSVNFNSWHGQAAGNNLVK